jgi:hypothetical protein
MIRPIDAFILCALAGAQAALAQGTAPSPQAVAEAQKACSGDVQRFCSGVQAGGGRILACLKQHKSDVSDACKQAVIAASQGAKGDARAGGDSAPAAVEHPPGGGGGTPAQAPAKPQVDGVNSDPAPAATPSAQESHASAAATASKGYHNYKMKQVQIIDKSSDKPNTVAYNLLIPATWKFDGFVAAGAGTSGCFSDFFAMSADAKSADGSIEMQMMPQTTWQYVDDPAGQKYLNHQNEQDTKYGVKPCKVRAPVRAADLMKQSILPQLRKGKTVVSIGPYPELDQLARGRLGLLPASGGNLGTIRTDAARARLSYDDDKGQPVEEWITAVVVVRTVPAGRGSGYDWRLVNLMSLRAPKGQLDGNDKLFLLIASTLHPDPNWKTYSDGVITKLYQAKTQEIAKQNAIIAQFQQHVIDTINGVVANQQAGAERAAYGQDQIIRGVQTFRDPSSGATYEMSSQYNHAWLNGNNEYIMSDDPNYNPNGDLNGNWTQLQPQR